MERVAFVGWLPALRNCDWSPPPPMMCDAKSLHAEFGTNFRLILFPGTCTRRLCEQHSSSCIFTAFCNSEPVSEGQKTRGAEQRDQSVPSTARFPETV